MTLNDKEIQELQGMVKKELGATEGTVFQIPNQDKYYQIVHSVDMTTQAMAVVPVDDREGHNPNFQETTIVVGGTQVPFEHMKYWDNQPYFWKKDFEITASTTNAFLTSGWFGMVQGGLTPQTADIDEFYQNTLKKARVEDKNAIISNMSGHSQSGPGVAYTASKYGLLENRAIKVTNFMDFEAHDAVASGAISKEQVNYLNKNATIYRDSRGDVVFLDGNNGDVPYGKTMRFEVLEGEDGHSPRTPVIKGDKLDVDYYYRKNLFASGMTEKQVREIAKRKAELFKYPETLENVPGVQAKINNPEFYVNNYLQNYGPFAPEPSNQDLLNLNRKKINQLHSELKKSRNGELYASSINFSSPNHIKLREELVRTSAQTVQLQAEVYEQEIKDKLASAKSKVEEHISELSKAAYTLAHNLSAGEVEELLSELSLSTAWNGGTEASTLASANSYMTTMTGIAGNLNKAADRIVEIDQQGAQIFTNK